jgi:hypothetical protein
VSTCQGHEKDFTHLTTWELLNLRASTILDLPELITKTYPEDVVDKDMIDKAMKYHSIQNVGRDVIDRQWGIEDKPMKYLVSSTKHYSWPKAAGTSSFAP